MDNMLLRTGSKIITTVGYESIWINEEEGIWGTEKEWRSRCTFWKESITFQYLVNTQEHHTNAFTLSSKIHLLQVPPEEEAKGTHAAVCQYHSLTLEVSLFKVCHHTAITGTSCHQTDHQDVLGDPPGCFPLIRGKTNDVTHLSVLLCKETATGAVTVHHSS